MRALVIGFDGATYTVLNPLMQAGYMPNLLRVLARGASGKLLSTIPPVTALAWPTFMTGKNPGKHGLLGWQEPLNKQFERPWVSGNKIDGAKLWELVGAAGLRVCIVNVPVTYPPEPVNGVMVTGMLTPGLHVEFTYPAGLKADLLKEVPGYRLDVDVQRTRYEVGSWRSIRRLLDEVRIATQERGKAFRWLLQREHPDFAMVVFEMPDRLQHVLWRYIEALPHALEGVKGSESIRDRLLACYQALDEEIGLLVNLLPSDAYLVLLSDHGFGPLKRNVYLNDWLAQHGWLHYNQKYARGWDLLRLTGSRIKRWLPSSLFWKAKQALPLFKTLDWTKTWAYAGLPTENGIFLNVRGREPAGIIERGSEYERIREEIIAALKEWRDPWTGSPVMLRVYRREDVYKGPYTERAPDIVFELQPGYRVSEWKARGGVLEDASRWPWGIHEREGIFAMSGPGIMPGTKIDQATIQDVAPTLLYALGLPIPDDMDGQVMLHIFTSSWRSSHPTRYRPAPQERARWSETPYSPEDEERIANRLRGLGYLN